MGSLDGVEEIKEIEYLQKDEPFELDYDLLSQFVVQPFNLTT